MSYEDFLLKLSNPARNALLYEGIDSFEKLANHSEREILKIHGVGPKSIPTIKAGLEEIGFQLRND